MVRHYVLGALRSFRRDPLATAIKLAALSLGLLCFLTAYVFADFVGRADTHWANAGRIYAVEQSGTDGANDVFAATGIAAAPLAKYLRLDLPELAAVARFGNPASVLAPDLIADTSDRLTARGADAELLTIFDLPLVAGNGQNALREPHSAVITADLATRLFGDVRGAIGQSMLLEQQNQTNVTVTGVVDRPPSPSALAMPFGQFDLLVTMDVIDDLQAPNFPTPPDATPEQIAQMEAARRIFRRSEAEDWRSPFSTTFILLPEGPSIAREALQSRLDVFAAQRIPPDQGSYRFTPVALEAALSGQIDRWFIRGATENLSLRGLLYGFGAMVLAVACLNFTNLTTAEVAARGQEIGLRKTIGAGRRQIALQTLAETLMLALAALALMLAALWLGLASWETSRTWGLNLPALERPSFWAGVGAIVIGVSLVAGAYPALVLARVSPLAAHHAGSFSRGGGTVRSLLSGAQFAAAAALLTGTFVIWLQNEQMRRSAMGLTEDPVVMLYPSGFARAGAPTPPGNDVMRAEMMADPSVLAFTASMSIPFDGAGVVAQQRVRLSPDENAPAYHYESHPIGYDYFATLGVPLIAGREFHENDPEMQQSPVIIDAGTARHFGMSPQSAVGQTLYIWTPSAATAGDSQTRAAKIIGVLEEPPYQLRANGTGLHIWSYINMIGFQYVLRIDKDDVAGALAHIRDTQDQLMPGREVGIQFLDERFEQAFRMFSRITAGLMALCLMAVAIAAMGLFGMASFVVQRRIREIGVRKTLGASSLRVLGLLLWDFSKPVLLANLIAWPVAWIASQTYLNLFADRIALTPWPFLAALLVSLIVAWLAVGAQAIGAARAKPARVLQAG